MAKSLSEDLRVRLISAVAGGMSRRAAAELKAFLRKAEARTPDKLWDAIADGITRFSAEECAHYFAAAGY
jgi:hypothetical protein